jgi:hypothetical protein
VAATHRSYKWRKSPLAPPVGVGSGALSRGPSRTTLAHEREWTALEWGGWQVGWMTDVSWSACSALLQPLLWGRWWEGCFCCVPAGLAFLLSTPGWGEVEGRFCSCRPASYSTLSTRGGVVWWSASPPLGWWGDAGCRGGVRVRSLSAGGEVCTRLRLTQN